MKKDYNVKIATGETVKLSYETICHTLGFVPEVRFVEITNRGTIGFSVGKPNEIKALLSACQKVGYVPSKKLIEAANL